MQLTLLPMLQCPLCQAGEIKLHHASTRMFIPVENIKQEFVSEGLLECKTCKARFPVINHVPTLLPENRMTNQEKAFVKQYNSSQKTKILDYIPLSAGKRLAKIKALLLQFEFYREETYPDEKSKAWIRNGVDYEIHKAILKDKYVNSLSYKLRKSPRTILDIGGGQGGPLYCFKQHFKPSCAVLLDMDDRFTPIAQLRDETINVIRGDATRMPFKRKAFDLTISNGCLEHVHDWPAMLAEIKRTGIETYLSYTPNGSFPWEIGHLAAPLVTVLPKPLARHICYGWHKLLNNKQYTYELIDHLLNITYFVPSRRFARECKKQHIDAINMFSVYTIEASKAVYHHTYGKYVRFLGRHPMILKLFTGMAMAFHVEPVVHYYLYHPE